MSQQHRQPEQLDAHPETFDRARLDMGEHVADAPVEHAAPVKKNRERWFDRALAAGLADVPVPEGLEARLLAAIQADEADDAQRDISPVTPVAVKGRWRVLGTSRRLWSVTAAAAAVLVMAAGGMAYWHWSRQIFEQQQIASALNGYQVAISHGRSERGLPRDFVLPPLPVKPQRYLPFKTAEGWSAVAVDCTTAAGSPATLIIVQQPSYFRSGASAITRLAPSGTKVAAWREGRLLYVLVEEVAKPRAGAMIRRSAAPPA
jgi:hypothetical protein